MKNETTKTVKQTARYAVTSKEEGRGPGHRTGFTHLAEVQKYVKDRWFGPDYIDGPQDFHGDYATFHLTGCKLSDLGKRRGPQGTDDYWNWQWLDLSPKTETWAAEVEVIGEPGQWHGNGLRFQTENEALEYARGLAARWTLVTAFRAVQSQDAPAAQEVA